MVLHGETFSHLDLLVQRSLRYKHHKLNYIQSLEEGIIPSGLKIKKKPAFQIVSDYFEDKWNSILYNAERNIVELLLYEVEKVIAKIQVEIQEEVDEKNPEKFERERVCGVRKIAFSFSEEAGSETQEEVEKS